jgi:hypothetical protein
VSRDLCVVGTLSEWTPPACAGIMHKEVCSDPAAVRFSPTLLTKLVLNLWQVRKSTVPVSVRSNPAVSRIRQASPESVGAGRQIVGRSADGQRQVRWPESSQSEPRYPERLSYDFLRFRWLRIEKIFRESHEPMRTMFFSCFQRRFQRRGHGLDERSCEHGSSDGCKQQRNKNRVTD